jgi:hypothetical protein
VDGFLLSGFKEGDFIQVKVDGNAMARTHGGDGPSMNISTDQGGQITIGLNPTSPAMGPLTQLRNQQKRNPRLFSIQVISGVEELISASGCGFGELPQFSTGGPTQQGRDFLFECLQIDLDVALLAPVDGGLLGGVR